MKTTAHLAALLVALLCTPAVAALPESPKAEELLLRLFPTASLRPSRAWFGRPEAGTIVSPVTLRGRHGLIRVADARLRAVGDAYLALAFEVLLTSEGDAHKWVESGSAPNPPGAMKLLQIVLFDRRTGEVLGKPVGFPLEGEGWTCAGDACAVLTLLDLEGSAKREPYVVLRYSTGLDRHLLRVVAVGADRTPIASGATATGDLSGESGCRVEVSFASFTLTRGRIVGARRSECDPSCAELCRSNGLPPGKSDGNVPLLTLERP